MAGLCEVRGVTLSASSQRRRNRWHHWLFLSPTVILCCLVPIYVGSYYYLSRRGMAELKVIGGHGFFYVPTDEIGPNTPGMKRHAFLVALYDPINKLDCAWFGGGSPCRGITWSLSQ